MSDRCARLYEVVLSSGRIEDDETHGRWLTLEEAVAHAKRIVARPDGTRGLDSIHIAEFVLGETDGKATIHTIWESGRAIS